MERETSVCQEKMRALRDENVRLSEMCTELESATAEASREQQICARTGSRTSRSSPRGMLLSAAAGTSMSPRGACSGALDNASSSVLMPMSSRTAVVGGSLQMTPRTIASASCAAPPHPSATVCNSGSAAAWVYDTPVTTHSRGWAAVPFAEPVAEAGQGVDRFANLRVAPHDEDLASRGPPPESLEYLRTWIQNEEDRLVTSSPRT